MRYKNITAVFLVLLLCLCALTLPTYAQVETSNVAAVSVDCAYVGETITVQIQNSAMTVSSFTCGVAYDREKLALVSVAGMNELNPENVSIHRASDNAEWNALVYSTLAESEVCGTVGFAFVNCKNELYAAGSFAEITFKVLKEGRATLTVYEDSDGEDGLIMNCTQEIMCQNNTTGDGSGDDVYNVSGVLISYGICESEEATLQLIPLNSEDKIYEIKVGGTGNKEYKIENILSGTYTLRVSKAKHLTMEYQIVIDNKNKIFDIQLYLLGDYDCNGIVEVTDAKSLQSAILGKSQYQEMAQYTCDINGDGRITAIDLALIAAAALGKYQMPDSIMK